MAGGNKFAPAPPTDLTDRLNELSWQLEDLLEETKQVQILLSRIITLLERRGALAGPASAAPPGTAWAADAASALAGPEGRDASPLAGVASTSTPTGAPGTHAAGFGAGTRPASAGTPSAAMSPAQWSTGHLGSAAWPTGDPATAPWPAGELGPAPPPTVIREAAVPGDEAMRAWEPQAL